MDNKPIIPSQGGVFQDMMLRLKLIMKLMADRRVSVFAKLIPLGALIYLVSPVDLAPGAVLPVIGALDDAAVLGFGSYLFIEMCPPEVVRELAKRLTSNNAIVEEMRTPPDDVIDAETTEVKDDEQK
jgi:uncharacterized membrane protein YkvA (DUF1232 family)